MRKKRHARIARTLGLTALMVAAFPIHLSTSLHAETGFAPKWGAHVDLEGKWGNRRSLGDVGLFAPLLQNHSSLLFADIRGRLDDRQSREGNFGLGLRHMLLGGWNAGLYAYYDARRTGQGSFFQQAALGAELLSADFDLRVNGYLPLGTREQLIALAGPGGPPFAEFANGTIQIVTPGSGRIVERALRGVDGEVGWRLPAFPAESLTQIRAFAGGFWFDGEGVTQSVAGPRGRIELSFEKSDGAFSGARLTLGAEVQHDAVRGVNAFAVARLRVPLQAVVRTGRLSPQERRMTERVVRDVDVVAVQRSSGLTPEVRENAVNVYNEQTVTNVVQVNGASGFAAVQGAINTNPAGSIVILNGNLNSGALVLFVAANRTLIGGGAVLPVRGATTGTAANFVAPGAAGGVAATGSGTVVAPLMNSVVGGLTIQNQFADAGSVGIYATGNTGVTVFGNSVSTVSLLGHAIFMDTGTHNAKLIGNTVQTAGAGAHGIFVRASANVTVARNVFGPAMGAGANDFRATNNTTIVTADSTGNVDNSAATRCGGDGTAAGTVSFTTAPNCVYP